MTDIHIPMEQCNDGIWFVQSGSLEMKSVDEPQDKSVEIVDFDDNGNVVSMKRVPYPTRKVVFENVNTEEDVDRVLALDPESIRENLTVCYVANTIRSGAARLSDYGKRHGLMFRVVPVGDAETREATKDFDRRDSMNLLYKAVETFFEKDSEQYRMVLDILSTGNPRMVVENYLNEDDGHDENG